MFNLTFFSGNRIDASALEPGEPLTCLVLFGSVEVDFTGCDGPPLSAITVLNAFGGVRIYVRPEQPVRLDGFGLFGGRNVEPRRLPGPTAADDDPPPLAIDAFNFFGGVMVQRE